MTLTLNNETRPILFYDTEVFKNYFLFTFCDMNNNITNIDSRLPFFEILTSLNKIVRENYLIGFNNFHYDDIILTNALVKPTTSHLKLINDDIFYHSDKKIYKYFSINNNIKSFDLMKNINTFVSLKTIMCNLGINIQEYKKGFDEDVLKDEIEEIVKYCLNDVLGTKRLYEEIKSDVDMSIYLLDELKQYNRYSNAKLCNMIYCNGNRFPYLKVIDSFKLDNKFINDYFDNLNNSNTNTIEPFKFNMYDNEIMLGAGGCHSVNPKFVNRKLKNVYCLDFESLYPNLAILLSTMNDTYNRLLPTRLHNKRKVSKLKQHFKKIESSLDNDERIRYLQEIDELNKLQTNQKLSLNKTFGTLNNEYMPHSDVYKLFSITLSGQKVILKLCELLTKYTDYEIIQINTDGIFFVSTNIKDNVDSIEYVIDKSNEIVKIPLELDKFKYFYQKDVNNYCALSANSNIKRCEESTYEIKAKGAMLGNYKAKNVVKNNNLAIIDLALINKLLFDIDIKDTVIQNKDNLILFQIVARVTKAFDCIIDNNNVEYQHVNRIFATKDGISTLYKYKRTEQTKTKISDCPSRLKICNSDLSTYKDLDIDLDYYIELAESKLMNWTNL